MLAAIPSEESLGYSQSAPPGPETRVLSPQQQVQESMQIAYLDCATGISGDMTLAALIDAGADEAAIRGGVKSLGLPGVVLHVDEVVKGGFRAKHVRVEHPEQHAHRHLSDVAEIIDRASALTTGQKDLAMRIFRAVAEAEAHVHGSSPEKVHFHEVGAIDSIVDIVGAALGFDLLGVDHVVCSPIPPGHGFVQIAHGTCPVPAPGTAELLKGIPLRNVPVEAELTTPTGAAIVKVLVDRFDTLPPMTIEQVGYGAGTMDFPGRANILRIFVGPSEPAADRDQVCLLETNLDDVSGEIIGHTRNRLMEAGALDVYTTSIQMKKDRPGVILSVLGRPADRDRLESILFAETGTLGVRRHLIERSIRARREHVVETPWGPVAGKLAWRTGEAPVFTPEFDDCARVAGEQGLPLREVYRAAQSAFAAAIAKTDVPAATPQTAAPVHDHDHDHDHDHG